MGGSAGAPAHSGDDTGTEPANPAAERMPREIWILVLGNFIIAVGTGIIAPALPAFATSFNVGVTAASVVISGFAFMRLAFAPASGRLVGLFGERPVYLWGIGIVGLSTAACAVAGAYWQLLLFRGLGGIGSTMFTVSGVALLVRLAPPHLRGRASGMWATSFLLGNISGPIVGGALVGFSLRLPFVSYAVALALATLIGWLMLRRSQLAAPDTGGEETTMSVRSALRRRSYRAALLSNFSNGWAVFGVRMSLIPLFVVEVLHVDRSLSGVALSVFAAGNAAVLLVSGRLSDSCGRKPLVLLGLAVSAAGSVALGLSGTIAWFMLASLVAGIGAGLLNPAQNAAVADVVGNRSRGGPVLAGFQMSADLGAILGPLVAGAIAEALSFQLAFAATGLAAVLAFAAWVGAPETREKQAG
ncbi:MFS transporter [Salinifilum aidingensis]